MSKIPSIIRKLAQMTRVAEEADDGPYEPEFDIEALKSEIRPYTDYVEVDFSALVKMLEDSGTEEYLEIPDSYSEQWGDDAYDVALDVMKREGITDDDHQDYEDVKDALVEKAHESISHEISVSGTLLIDTGLDHVEYSEIEADTTEEAIELFKATEVGKAAAGHFTDAQLHAIVQEVTHTNQSTVIYLGALCDGGDVISGNWTVSTSVSGTPVLVAHESIDGSGNYEIGKGDIEIAPLKGAKDLLDRMDYGSYSMGDVTGTSDWDWKYRG